MKKEKWRYIGEEIAQAGNGITTFEIKPGDVFERKSGFYITEKENGKGFAAIVALKNDKFSFYVDLHTLGEEFEEV